MSINLAISAASVLYGKKAQDINLLDVSAMTIITDYMIIASGRSVIQVRTLSDEIERYFAAESVLPRRIEGYREGRWIIMDYNHFILHLFHQEERAFYHLERLWDNGTNQVLLPFADTDNP